MSRVLRVASLSLLVLICFAAPFARADSIPIGQMEFMNGGCNQYTCYKTWIWVSIYSGGLTDSHGLPYGMDLSGTFSVRDMSGNWGPVFGWTNIQLSDFSSQVFNLGYVCTPCSGLRLDLTLNDPAALLLNGKIVYPGTTFSVILLPTNGPYLQPGVMESIYLPTSIATPEPSSLILTGTGLMGLAATIKRKLGVRRRKAE